MPRGTGGFADPGSVPGAVPPGGSGRAPGSVPVPVPGRRSVPASSPVTAPASSSGASVSGQAGSVTAARVLGEIRAAERFRAVGRSRVTGLRLVGRAEVTGRRAGTVAEGRRVTARRCRRRAASAGWPVSSGLPRLSACADGMARPSAAAVRAAAAVPVTRRAGLRMGILRADGCVLPPR